MQLLQRNGIQLEGAGHVRFNGYMYRGSFTDRVAMPAALSRAVVAWLVLVCTCGLVFERRCGHTQYDYRASRRFGCTLLKGRLNDTCFQPPLGCVDAMTLMAFSPRPLSDTAGHGGPLLTWLPLMFYRGDLRVTQILLARSMIWYLAVIGATRHLHVLTGWDPSGHVIVYGSQLVPLWVLLEVSHAGGGVLGPGRMLILCWLLVWAGVLCYLSVMTTVAFHTLSETSAAASLVCVLAMWVRDCDSLGVQTRHVVSAAVAWMVPTALSLAARSASLPLLLGMLLYDLFVWLCFVLVLGEERREILSVLGRT